MSNFSNLKNNSLKTLGVALIFLLGSCTPGTPPVQPPEPQPVGPDSGPDGDNTAPIALFVFARDVNGGELQIGDTLNCDYVYEDAEGDLEGKSIYSYLRDNFTIDGADKQTYNTVTEDGGKSITCNVQAVAQTGELTEEGIADGTVEVPTSENAITTAFTLNRAPTASAVTLTDVNGGIIEVDDVLRCEYIFEDLDDDVEGDSIYKYLRDNLVIVESNNPNYIVVRDDVGRTLRCEVTPVSFSGVSEGEPVEAINEVEVPGIANNPPTASDVAVVDINGGDAVVGDELKCDYKYDDVEGDLEGDSEIAFTRNDNFISGANDPTYRIVSADAGATLSCEVTPVAVSGASVGVLSVTTSVNEEVIVKFLNRAPTASAVSIVDTNGGDTEVGDVLSCDYTYFDADGDSEGNTTFSYTRSNNPISGANDQSYTAVSADIGQSLRCEVTPIASTGVSVGGVVTVASANSVSVATSNSPPTASAVSITGNNGGDAEVGDILSCAYTYDDVDGDAEGNSAFTYTRNNNSISGTNNQSYTVVSADIGQALRCQVGPVAISGITAGNTVTSSNSIQGIAANSKPTASSVTISGGSGGNAEVGDRLTCNYSYSDADNDPEGSTRFSFTRNGSSISGATSRTYTVVSADEGDTLRCRVTPIATRGETTGNTVTSSNSIQGIAANSKPTASSVSISGGSGGNAEVGDRLTCNYSYSDADNDPEGSTRFSFTRNGSSISGATSRTYTVVSADIGQSLRCKVTPIATSGVITGSSVTSSSVFVNEPVILNSPPTANNVRLIDVNGGDLEVDDEVICDYDYQDVDGDAEGVSLFSHSTNGVPDDIFSQSVFVSAGDDGDTWTCKVTPVALDGDTVGEAVTSNNFIIELKTNSAPTASGVSIRTFDDSISINNVGVGDVLVCDYNYVDVDGDAEGATTFSYTRNNSAISGANSRTYTVVSADEGDTLRCVVTPVASSGVTTGSAVTSSNSAQAKVANSAPVASSVRITYPDINNIRFGDILTCSYSYSDSDADSEGATEIKWVVTDNATGAVLQNNLGPGITYTLSDLGIAGGWEVRCSVRVVAISGTQLPADAFTRASNFTSASSGS